MIIFAIVIVTFIIAYTIPLIIMFFEECVMKIPKEDFRSESQARKEFRQRNWWLP